VVLLGKPRQILEQYVKIVGFRSLPHPTHFIIHTQFRIQRYITHAAGETSLY